MYLDDPHTIIRPFVPKPPPKMDARILSFMQEGQGAGRGHTVGAPMKGLMGRNICLYVNGRHAMPGDNCPHLGQAPHSARQADPEPIRFRPMTPRPQ